MQSVNTQLPVAVAQRAGGRGDAARFQVVRAEHYGMCFGVRDAIDQARAVAQRQALTVLGDLVHNPAVVRDLEAHGVRSVNDPDRVTTGTVMITAHGASDRRLVQLRGRGLRVMEATCPLVQAAHRAVQGLESEGFFPVVVGVAGHVEVRGLTEDLEECAVVLRPEDIEAVPSRPRYGVVAQTTQPIQRVRWLADLLRRRFPQAQVRLVDTVCQPTKLRQHAAVEVARQCDVVIVVGGARSNNTRELVETCRQHCARTHHVEGPADLQPGWLAGAVRVGLTAGTSTPDDQIEAVERRLVELAQRTGPGTPGCPG